MTRLVKLVGALALIAASAGALVAQESSGGFFRQPVFVVMPSVITLNAISSPDDTHSGFNVRFQTVLPTRSKWITGVAGVQFMPNGPGGGTKLNQPIVFYGGIIPVIPADVTNGWLGVTFDPLGVYFLNPRGGDRPYSHEFVAEGAAVLNIGAKMMKGMGLFQNTSAFFILDQRITHPDLDAAGNEDRFRPVLVYGILLPIAP